MRARWRSRHHALPDLLILGAQKCGTSSLFAYLASLPGFIPPTKKELHHFDSTSGAPSQEPTMRWYRSQFPFRSRLAAAGAITGEATPSYMFEPLAMDRIARDLPGSKWIVVLRDPVERAFSQYRFRAGRGLESTSFAEQVNQELTRLRDVGPVRELRGNGSLLVQRGHFADQLAHLGALRPNRPTLVLFSENLFAGDRSSFELLHDFIGLPEPRPESFPHRNPSAATDDLDPQVRDTLRAQYARVNAGLAELLRSDRFVTVDPALWPNWVESQAR